MAKRKQATDFAEIEHLEHEAADARDRVRFAKAAALREAGWIEYVYEFPYGDNWGQPKTFVRYAPRDAKRERVEIDPWVPNGMFATEPSYYRAARERFAKRKVYRYTPHYDIGTAFNMLRRDARKRCGPTSCERPPRKR